jgi:NAD(P)-dependent dehydrogenase (short-subunit alcohol dehydrogenase family)
MSTKAGIKAMKKFGESIINVCSIKDIVDKLLIPSCKASKGGVRIFKKSAAWHCVDQNYPVRINPIHPDFVINSMVSGAMTIVRSSEVEVFGANVMNRISIKRFATADEIVCPILFLASEASSYMTGSELVVDGGMTVR